ncbi:hypothetical protein I7I51_05012 [Histoplasma capsulatum]|uniref:Uncharacterized protein n=1 Tax=Ajellomyces capsulatus TaxID=5037 RepID=A0A8A1M3M5_AJECA|nr:hypothetical protein I7I51_05012 [Histoplasma capsulatum]
MQRPLILTKQDFMGGAVTIKLRTFSCSVSQGGILERQHDEETGKSEIRKPKHKAQFCTASQGSLRLPDKLDPFTLPIDDPSLVLFNIQPLNDLPIEDPALMHFNLPHPASTISSPPISGPSLILLQQQSGPDQAVIGKHLGGEEMPRPLSSLKSPFFRIKCVFKRPVDQDQVTAWNTHGPVCKRHSRSMKSFLVKPARDINGWSSRDAGSYPVHIQSMMKQLTLDLHLCIGRQTVLWLLPCLRPTPMLISGLPLHIER